jgi:hypothetical protein
MPPVEETNKTATSNAEKTNMRKEMPYKQAVITLVIGDALCFLIFAAIGSGSHGEVSGVSSIPHIIVTALPFVAGWFLVSPFVGAFRRMVVAQPRVMVIRTGLAWVLAWPVTMLLRGIFVDHGVPPLTFAIIALLFNLGILLLWRWPFALNNSLRKRGA